MQARVAERPDHVFAVVAAPVADDPGLKVMEILQNETADVVLRLEDVRFLSGHDLETFAQKQRIDVGTGDIEQ